ncbi:MAG: type II toxin-antitoxin system RelE/ParE family toxin [Desulfobacteraceae bacterium]|nr:type II toxin-antitoxin system RelE/ParE family toxin [Desulfobacteraceae bacterium]
MIASFSSQGLKDFYLNGSKRGIQAKHADKLSRMLDQLNGAVQIRDLLFPGSGLHKKHPREADDHKQVWAMKVSGNWRLQFLFYDGNTHQVDYLDYH